MARITIPILLLAAKAMTWDGRPDLAARSAGPAPTSRSFRILALLAAVATISLCDLALTHAQLARGNFAELNTLAAAALGQGTGVMAAYKLLLLGLGVGILYRLRRHWQTEAALWLLLACHVGLVAWWLAYLEAVEICIHDPAVVATVVPF